MRPVPCQGANEAAAPVNGDRQPHFGLDHGVRETEHDCHTVGDGQSKVIIIIIVIIFVIENHILGYTQCVRLERWSNFCGDAMSIVFLGP